MKKWITPAVVALAAAAASTAFATIPSASGVINACYKPFGGALRLIDAEAGAKCSDKERPLAWNAQGPKGEKGDKGDAGPQGVPGRLARRGPRGRQGRPGRQAASRR